MKPINVLSLFDGMSCGRIALDRCGIPVKNYFASEVDKYAIKVAKANYPNTIHIGDVCDVMWPETFEGIKIDLLIGGSPCQGFSFAGKQLNFDDPRSKLFWEFVRLFKECNPKYFLLENVRMKKDSMDVITKTLGVEPILINSNLVSAQNRQRYYWTNIPIDKLPEDKGIMLRDILEGDCEITDAVKASPSTGLAFVGHAASIKCNDNRRRVYHPSGKAPTLMTTSGGYSEPKVLCGAFRGRYNSDGSTSQRLEIQESGRSNSLTTVQKDNVVVDVQEKNWRKLSPLECERLQTVPDNYTAHVSNTQRYKMLGNGWTVDVVAHIFDSMKGVAQ